MVFSSPLFLFYFLPAALLLYFASPLRLRNLTLTIVITSSMAGPIPSTSC